MQQNYHVVGSMRVLCRAYWYGTLFVGYNYYTLEVINFIIFIVVVFKIGHQAFFVLPSSIVETIIYH